MLWNRHGPADGRRMCADGFAIGGDPSAPVAVGFAGAMRGCRARVCGVCRTNGWKIYRNLVRKAGGENGK